MSLYRSDLKLAHDFANFSLPVFRRHFLLWVYCGLIVNNQIPASDKGELRLELNDVLPMNVVTQSAM